MSQPQESSKAIRRPDPGELRDLGGVDFDESDRVPEAEHDGDAWVLEHYGNTRA